MKARPSPVSVTTLTDGSRSTQQRLVQTSVQCVIERIQPIRPVEPDSGDTIGDVEKYGLLLTHLVLRVYAPSALNLLRSIFHSS